MGSVSVETYQLEAYWSDNLAVWGLSVWELISMRPIGLGTYQTVWELISMGPISVGTYQYGFVSVETYQHGA